jgi:hypothetical protein
MTDNKLIAEFMGMEDYQEMGEYVTPNYNTSWDWLMTVVIKCFEVDEQTNDDLNFKLNDALLETNIDSLYQAVVQFINQYNNK